MKVLLLPVNIASDISHKVRSLRAIGVDAQGFSIAGSTIQTSAGIKIFSINRGNAVTLRARRAIGFAKMWRMIAWADVLHWVADANIFDGNFNRRFLSRVNKPGVVQWTGSDIRIPEIDFAVNSFYKQAFAEDYEYKIESAELSQINQKFFAELEFYPLEFIGMSQYIDSKLFPRRFRTWQSIYLPEHAPNFPAPTNTKPVIVHSPSAPVAKGTKYVLQAVKQLKSKYDFDFVLVQNVERAKALEIMSRCDIYVDQLILGAHGYAAVEAMAFGKPVVCYINQEIGRDYPPDLPIVNANPDTIAAKLAELLGDAALRCATGIKSREYVEKYHDEQTIARDLVKIYEEVIALHRTRRGRN